MLSEALPIYSGGLGNVAGDQLKAASDLGVPVIGVGLLYQQGYFRQLIDSDGSQQALFPYNDPGQLPITPLRATTASGCDCSSTCRVIRCGCAPGRRRWAGRGCYCSTAMIRPTIRRTAASPASCTAAARSCACGRKLVLGIGGWRLLRGPGHRAAGVPPERRPCGLCRAGAGAHLHAAVPARLSTRRWRLRAPAICSRRTRPSPPASTASLRRLDRAVPGPLCARAGSGITPSDLLGARPQNARMPASLQHGLSRDPRQRRGQRRQPPARQGQPRSSSAPLFPRWPEDEVPVGHVTNGVHMCPPGTPPRPTHCGPPPAARIAGWGPTSAGAAASAGSAMRISGTSAMMRARQLIDYVRGTPVATAGRFRGERRRGRRGRAVARPEGAHAGLRAPLRHLQATEPAAARSAAAAAPAARSADARCSSSSPAKRIRPMKPGQALIQAMAAVHPRHPMRAIA